MLAPGSCTIAGVERAKKITFDTGERTATVTRCERVWPSVCSLKVLYIVCYIASVPVCVLRRTHNPILSGIRCFLRRYAQRATRTHK